MTERAHLSVTAIDEEGDVQVGADVAVFEADGSTPYAGTIYDAPTGGAVVTTHETDSLGRVDRWVENTDARTVRLTVEDRSGQIPSAFAIDPSILVRQGTEDAVVLDGYGGTEYALTVQSQNATTSKSLAVENQAGSKVLTVERASSNQNDAVRINLLSATVPTQNLLEVRAAKGVAYQLADFELQATAPGIIQTTVRATASQTVTGISNVVGLSGVATRSALASAGGSARGVEGHVATTVVGAVSGGYNAAVAAISDILPSGVAADAAFYAGGLGAGFTYLLYYQNAAGTRLFSVDNGGGVLAGPGNTSLPSYSFVTDPDTGVYSGGVNQLGISTGAVPQYLIRADGILDFRNTANQVVGIGAGATVTLGKVGGSGPVSVAQTAWLKIALGGSFAYLPYFQ